MRIVFVSCFAFFYLSVVAQIKFSEKLQHNPTQYSLLQKYDSLSNININNVMSHKGQTICYVGDKTEEKNGWTSDFYSNALCVDVYRPINVIDARGRRVVRTDYHSLVGRNFRVCEVYDYNPENELDKKFRLQLVDVEQSDTIYWKWEPHPKYSFSNFITLGYFEKMKERYIGDTMILKLTHYRQILQNGEKTDIISGTKYKCIDIVVTLNDSHSLRAILENERYGKTEAYLKGNWGNHSFMISDFYSQKHINSCIKKFGSKYGKQIGCGQIDIGMTEAMVNEAYGKPNKINYTVLGNHQSEQWVYEYEDYIVFVYFENGKVVAIQN